MRARFNNVKNVKHSISSFPNVELKKKIGEGSYSKVFLAESVAQTPDEKEQYAIKSIKYDHRYGIRSLIEIDILTRLHHPNLLGLVGLRIEKDKIELCVPLALGDIYTYTLQKHPSYVERFKLLHDVGLGVDYLHQNNILHLDLKPDNILIIQSSDTRRAVVADYSISIYTNESSTRNYQRTLVTLSYRAPELLVVQPEAMVYTDKVDVWSYGLIILYIILANKPILRTIKNPDAIEGLESQVRSFDDTKNHNHQNGNNGNDHKNHENNGEVRNKPNSIDEQISIKKEIFRLFGTQKKTRETLDNLFNERKIPYRDSLTNLLTFIFQLDPKLRSRIKDLTDNRIFNLNKEPRPQPTYYRLQPEIVPAEECLLNHYRGLDFLIRNCLRKEINALTETTFLAIDIYQRVIHLHPFDRDFDEEWPDISLVSMTCLWIAWKLVEDTGLRNKDIIRLTGQSFSYDELYQQEQFIVGQLGGYLYPDNIYTASNTANKIVSAFDHACNCFVYPYIDLFSWYHRPDEGPNKSLKEVKHFSQVYPLSRYYQWEHKNGQNDYVRELYLHDKNSVTLKE